MHNQSKYFGIEILRIIAMIMIVSLHTLGQGGILASAVINTPHYHFAWILEIVCFCAVNIYALISGFVLSEKQFRLSRLINLWFTVAFYTTAITLSMIFTKSPPLNSNIILNALFPISRVQYWYLSAYFGVILFSPFLNIAIKKISTESLKKIFIPGVLFLSILPTLFSSDPLFTHVGYSAIWLCVLYIVGGLIKRFEIHTRFSKKILFTLFISMAVITYISKIVLIYATKTFFNIENECNVLITYISPTIIISSVALFCTCLKLKPSRISVRLTSFFAPTTLGVYIIHCNPFIWKHYLKDFAISFIQSNTIFFVLYTAVSIISIYVFCSGIDFIRIKIFHFLKISILSNRIDGFANKILKTQQES